MSADNQQERRDSFEDLAREMESLAEETKRRLDLKTPRLNSCSSEEQRTFLEEEIGILRYSVQQYHEFAKEIRSKYC